jgi:hypothetical protein
MKAWPGLQLIGAGSRCLKGMFYTVVACDKAKVELNTGATLTHQQPCASNLDMNQDILSHLDMILILTLNQVFSLDFEK